MWMFDADMVGVRFRDGKVAMVIGSPLAALSEAEAPAAPAAGAAAKPPSGAPAQPAPAPAPANTTHQRWLELEKQLKQQSNPEEMLLKLFGERPASDGK